MKYRVGDHVIFEGGIFVIEEVSSNETYIISNDDVTHSGVTDDQLVSIPSWVNTLTKH